MNFEQRVIVDDEHCPGSALRTFSRLSLTAGQVVDRVFGGRNDKRELTHCLRDFGGFVQIREGNADRQTVTCYVIEVHHEIL